MDGEKRETLIKEVFKRRREREREERKAILGRAQVTRGWDKGFVTGKGRLRMNLGAKKVAVGRRN